MQRARWVMIVSMLALGLVGCATMRGMGEDLKNLGKGIEKSIS